MQKKKKKYNANMKNIFGLKKNKQYNMLNEIFEQKKVFETLCQKFFDKDLNIITDELPLDKYSRIVICASGSSKHAGEIAKYFIEGICQIPCSVEFASEFAHKDIVLNKNELFIAISQSGNTADTFEALMKAKKKKAITFALTNNIESKIHKNADYKVLADAGLEQSIAATKSFTAQLLILYIFAIALAEKISGKTLDEIKKEFLTISEKYDDIFNQRETIKSIAKKIKKAKSVAIIGRHINSALAQEGSLKIKETCYINAVHSPAGEFMHGHFAFLDKKVPLIGILSNYKDDEENYNLGLNNLCEVQSKRKTKTILLKTCGDNIAQEKIKSKFTIDIPAMSKWFMPFLSLVALQLLAFETATLIHDNIDEPRDLKKCVDNE